MPQLLERTGVRTPPLTHSFRWTDERQASLARQLRVGEPVVLPLGHQGGADAEVDVVLGLFWKPLWAIGEHVLPLAYRAFKGGTEEAAATLLLNHVTRNIFSEDATYLGDALSALAIADADVPRQLEPQLQRVVELLRLRRRTALNTTRIVYSGRPVPGLTTHQAKRREWDLVGVRLTPNERAALAAGLTVNEDTHRKLYVACTRARRITVEV